VTRVRIRDPFDGKTILLKQRRNHNSRGEVNCLLASSLSMDLLLLTTTSRRSPSFTWCCISGKACRSSSRPSLARRPALGQTAASPTSQLQCTPTDGDVRRDVSAAKHCNSFFTSSCAPPLETIKGRGGQQSQGLDFYTIKLHHPGLGNELTLPTSL
jgi:hypothetical protein